MRYLTMISLIFCLRVRLTKSPLTVKSDGVWAVCL